MVTGPVTKNMREALERTHRATPDPKWVVAVGDCACTGGLFAGSYACLGGVAEVVPVDLHIRGLSPLADGASAGPDRARRQELICAPACRFGVWLCCYYTRL